MVEEETKELLPTDRGDKIAKYIELSKKSLKAKEVQLLKKIIMKELPKSKKRHSNKKNNMFQDEMDKIDKLDIIDSLAIMPTMDLQDFQVDQIISIVFYRMKVLLNDQEPLLFEPTENDATLIMDLVIKICAILFKNSDPNIINFYSSLLLHTSRTFIETLHKDSLDEGITIMKRTMKNIITEESFLTFENLDQDTQSLVDETNEFLQDIYNSKAYEDSLKQLFEEYYLEVDITEGLKYIKKLDKNQWIWVKNAEFQGMIGMNNIIFMNEIPKKKTSEDKIHLIQLILHEGAHQLLRFIKKDFGFLTPRAEKHKANVENEGMELGYRFEEIIFGSAVTLYDEVDSILNLDKWDKKPPILTAHEQEKQKKNYKVLNVYLSGICPKEVKLRHCF